MLRELIGDLGFMVLPTSHFPPAAGQGALAIECLKERADGGELQGKLAKLEDAQSALETKRERQDFQHYGGGCHLAVGIHARLIHDALYCVHRGEIDGQLICKTDYPQKGKFQGDSVFIGLPAHRQTIERNKKIVEVRDDLVVKSPYPATLPASPCHILVSSIYGMTSLDKKTKSLPVEQWNQHHEKFGPIRILGVGK